MDLSIRSIRAGDAARRHDLARQAFGGTEPFDPDRPVPDADRVVCAYDGEELVGAAVTLDFDMWWSEGAIPCGAVSGVAISPEVRGRGVARALMQESFRRMRSRGDVLSALYPTTATLYRGLGYEIAGSYETRTVPLGLLPTAPADRLRWRRTEFGDQAIRTVHEVMSRRLDGWFRTDDAWWARMVHLHSKETSKNRYAYVGTRDGRDVATVIYRYETSEERLYDLAVELLAGTDGDAVAGALGFLARNGTTAGSLRTTLPASVLALHVPNFQQTRVASDWPWMLRLVDVPSAFAARRWPEAVRGRVQLRVVDESMPSNAGAHVLELEDGHATFSAGGDGSVVVRVSDLAALYAGADVQLLRDAGRLTGADRADLDLLAAACATRPTMPFFF